MRYWKFCVLVLVLMITRQNPLAAVVTVPVSDSSFETPNVNQAQYAPYYSAPLQGQGTAWNVYDPTVATGTNSTNVGVFYNNPSGASNPATTGYITNADGSQLAFLSAQSGTQLYQTLAATYTTGSSYTLPAGFANSLFEPPTAASGSAQIQMSFFYIDGSGTMQTVPGASTLISASSLGNTALSYSFLTLPTITGTPAYLNKPIGIAFTSVGGNGGFFDVDNVSVPEPASLALLGCSVLALLRRPSRFVA